MVLQALVGVTPPERWMLCNMACFDKPSMSIICILNADEICLVRRAVTETFFIKWIMTNCSKYVHASREMVAHLTRQTKSALSIHINDIVGLVNQLIS